MEKGLKLTEADLKEIEVEKKANSIERMKFIKLYTDWLKKTPNKVWSKQQNKFLNK